MNNYIPDPKRHQYISFIKSGLRIVAGLTLTAGSMYSCGIFLILAEILGIAEEMV
jgi:hypothetical protein